MGWGLAVFFLSSLASGGAQQAVSSPLSSTAPAAAKETETPAAPATSANTSQGEYTVSPEDLLDVDVLGVPEVTRTYRVSSNGLLSLPLLPEPFSVAGETLDQLSHQIASKFREAGMLNNAQVTVSLRETRLHTVLVSGEVRKPQSYPVYGPSRLLDVLIQCGGLSEADGDDAIITRGDIGAHADLADNSRPDAAVPTGNDLSFSLNIRKLMQTGDDESNILLYPGDRIMVQRASMVYIMGAVIHPGAYVLNESRQQFTVLKALAVAGDVNNIAKKRKIVILRHNPALKGEKRDEIPVNYKAMVKGQIADIRLKPDDIVFVPESGGIKAMRTVTTMATTSVTAAAGTMMIYR